MKKIRILTTHSFERELKKLSKKQKRSVGAFESIINILQKDIFGARKSSNIKKLTDIKQGEGSWRIRLSDYRVRYDIVSNNVILHSIRNRRDAYR